MSTDTDNAAYLGNIPSMVAFLPGLSSEERSDLQDVLLDAQLFAGKQFDFKTQWSSWMHYYRSRLKARGMQQKGVILGDSLVVSNVDDLLQATFKVSNPADRKRLGSMVQRAFSAMGVSQAAEFYFQNGFDQGRLGSFQVVPCEKYEPNRTLLLLCSLHLSVDDHAPGTRRLLFHFKGGSYTFDRNIYAAHRDNVARYLDGKARSMVRAASI
ncbi:MULTISPECIES: hypothetical protein [Pseudomonas syringae group]|uniref:Uncharacterized protein n=4 Tax=Pseudomonas syringae group TaxID=136849 RepID=A0AAD0GS08_9PSED|nr:MULTISPECIES: hypothetical protein [Pseudomonas syringae group]AVB22197.1 hypothetical protein BKM03_25590 [Pseudomonas avellanae]EGH07814.1 hypothetical protein PSYMP_04490 [Pseudomonas amygdali pv. morsprunorum str. M302280]KWS63782.1 hypothetical protein AL055_25035 [Pseudomonas amygdali pv. morsprunorum]PHN45235.1 hypothetical protein AO261_09730 [Pseudomonas avellanae]POC95526.1 hypothetical protein BKM26_06925 [Pseudomonas avellanae]